MKLALAGCLSVLVAGINIFFILIPEIPREPFMLANGFCLVFGMAIIGYALVAHYQTDNPAVSVTPEPAVPKTAVPVEAPSATDLGDRAVINFLSRLQQKGRFIDFIMDDVSHYDDSQVGAAARVVHQGCSSVVRDYFDLVPVQESEEGSVITIAPEESAQRFRILGSVTGEPPYKGTLVHRGWRTTRVELPQSLPQAGTTDIVAPAEIEIAP